MTLGTRSTSDRRERNPHRHDRTERRSFPSLAADELEPYAVGVTVVVAMVSSFGPLSSSVLSLAAVCWCLFLMNRGVHVPHRGPQGAPIGRWTLPAVCALSGAVLAFQPWIPLTSGEGGLSIALLSVALAYGFLPRPGSRTEAVPASRAQVGAGGSLD